MCEEALLARLQACAVPVEDRATGEDLPHSAFEKAVVGEVCQRLAAGVEGIRPWRGGEGPTGPRAVPVSVRSSVVTVP